MADQSDEAELLSALLEQQGAYHNHKETMAYSAATLFLVGAISIPLVRPFWACYGGAHWWFFIGMLIFTGLAGCGYVYWQLDRRAVAAKRVNTMYEYAREHLPKELREQLDKVEPIPDLKLPEQIALLMPLVWSAIATAHVIFVPAKCIPAG